MYDGLLKKRFRTSQTSACSHLRTDDVHLFSQRIADFIAEWWMLEQADAPDPERDESANEARLLIVRKRIAKMPEAERHEAWDRIGVSFDRPEYAVKNYGCKVIGDMVSWPEGPKYPIKILSDREKVVEIMTR